MVNSGQAIGYCRISTAKQFGSDHYSLALQADVLKEMAVQHDTVLAAVFTDVGSGSNSNRTGLRQLCEAIERPNVKWLLVYRLNRLARNLKLLLSVFELCQKNNVQIVSKMEPEITETASGRLQLSMFGAVAQFERSVIVENQANALVEKKRQGEVLSSKVPYGYVYRSKYAVVDPDTAPVVQWLYQQYVATGMGYRRLTEACNRKFNLTLKQAHVARILRNFHYVGKNPNYPCLISELVFNQAQAKRSSRHVKKTHNDAWLHGKLVCPVCGRKLLVEASTRDGKRIRYYSCRRHGHSYSIRGEVAEQLVWGQLSYLLQKANWVRAVETKTFHKLRENTKFSVPGLRRQLEEGRISSSEFVERLSQIRESARTKNLLVNDYQQAISWVQRAFTTPTETATEFWQGLLDHVTLSSDHLVLGIFIKKWPTMNLLDMKEGNQSD